MGKKEKLEKWFSENSLTILGVIFLIAAFASIALISVYWYYFNSFPVKADAAPWGQLGDFFGGTLNPIFGFLSVIALLAALVIQSRELKISSEELRNSALALNAQNKAIAHQSFEQTFFSWLESYRELLGTIEHNLSDIEGGGNVNGRKALYNWWHSSLDANSVAYEFSQLTDLDISTLQWSDFFDKMALESPLGIANMALEKWDSVYQKNEYQLDSLFRNLYRLILWVDSQDVNRISAAQKWLYVSVVRAQLSWIEMVYLFYNGQTSRGSKFRRLVEKYALFDNLNFKSDVVITHLKLHAQTDIRYANTAYNSRLARKELGLPESTEETLAMAVV